ncbi:hypothetical protein K438DRAFT_1777951 [Mycena galopus ATCC 62051]|nr:hypothetical protein K438DRAFT_1777951 [Mycena galopus ATCC 62051]
MPLSLRDFALLWDYGFQFFLAPRTSPRFILDWNSRNADGTLLSSGYGVDNPRAPTRFFHERSEGASVMLFFGDVEVSQGTPGPEPVSRQDCLLRRWLATRRFPILEAIRPSFLDFARYVLSPHPLYLSPRHPVFEFHGQIAEYPGDWSLDEIAHQHFLACAWLGFWSIEERGLARWPVRVCWLRRPSAMSLPPMFDDLLDHMVLTFENHLSEYRQAREDHVDEDELRDKLFKFVLNMEQVLFWLSRLGFRVAWSLNYEQLMEQLFPDALLQFPPAQCRAEFNRLRASLFVSRRPGTQGQSARGLTVRFSTEGILEYLDGEQPVLGTRGELIPPLLLELASGDGRWVPLEESAPPGHILVGAELDLWIIALGYLPHLFYGATLPTPPPPPPVAPPAPPPSTAPPVAGPSRVSPPPRPSRSQAKKDDLASVPLPSRVRTENQVILPRLKHLPNTRPFGFLPVLRGGVQAGRGRGPRSLSAMQVLRQPQLPVYPGDRWWRKFSNAYEEGNEETLHDFRVEFWEHLGSGSFHPLHPDPRTMDWMEACRSYSYREFLSDLRPAQHTTRAKTRRKTAKKGGRRHSPTVIISSGSEDEGPAPKKRKTSRAGRESSAASSPEVIVVEDEEMPAVDDMQNYDLDGDVPMPPVDPSIAADPNNYDVELEPAPPIVPPEQQASSSRTTLDDPPPVASEPAPHFLGFRLHPIEEFSAAARPTFVDEIVQWAIEGEEDETRVESALFFMSAIFSQAGNTLGQRCRNGKGKVRE